MPVRQNAQAMAQPTCVEMQKVIDGVSGMNTDSICRPIREAQQELLGPVHGPFAGHQLRCRELEIPGECFAELARQVRHRGDVGDAAAVDPAEDLAGAETRDSAFGEDGFERRPVQISEVGAAGRHDICPVSN